MEEPSEAPSAETVICVHHWVLGSPIAGVTTGLCRDCGKSREFTDSRSPHPYLARSRRK